MLGRLFSLLQRKPEAEVTIVHPRLGRLKYVEGMWWQGQAPSKPEIEITISGNEQGPDEKQTELLLKYLQSFGAIEQKTHDFLEAALASYLPKVQASDFQIQSLDFLWAEKDGCFWVGMKLEGDEWGDWRLEFVNGEPKFLGRDD